MPRSNKVHSLPHCKSTRENAAKAIPSNKPPKNTGCEDWFFANYENKKCKFKQGNNNQYNIQIEPFGDKIEKNGADMKRQEKRERKT